MYPLSVLSHYPLGHIIYTNQSPIIDTVLTQLLTIPSKALALPYTAFPLSKQHPIYNLSIIQKRGGEGKKKLYKKNKRYAQARI